MKILRPIILICLTFFSCSNIFGQFINSEQETRMEHSGGVIVSASHNLDTTFNGGTGLAQAGFFLSSGLPWGAVQQSDGKIVGFHEWGLVHLVRFNMDGTIDTTFEKSMFAGRARSLTVAPNDEMYISSNGEISKMSPNGKFETFSSNGSEFSSSMPGRIYSTSIQADGKILATGTDESQSQFTMGRFNVDGTLDSTFNEDGIFTLDLTEETEWGRDIQELSDGSIMLQGWTKNSRGNTSNVLVKMDGNGVIDSTFGINGIRILEIGIQDQSVGFHEFENGQILMAGRATFNSSREIFIAKLNSDGSFNEAFGENGVVSWLQTNSSRFLAQINSRSFIYSESDHKIIVNGDFVRDGLSNQAGAVMRFNADGSLDENFGDNGMGYAELGDSSSFGFTTIFADDDGNIRQLGSCYNGTSKDIVMVKYLSNSVISSLSPIILDDEPISIYPNPVRDQVNLVFSLKKAQNLDIYLMNMNGQIINKFYQNQKFTEGKHQLSLTLPHTLTPGNYYITFYQGDNPIALKMMRL